jgi:23S rRNA pseudouridine955/2504/2580 synthase
MIAAMTAPVTHKPRPAERVVIDDGHAGQRIDNFLSARLKGIPLQRIYRSLRRGEVRVNSGRVRQNYRVQPGDIVRIPPLRHPVKPEPNAPAASLLARLDESIVYEDQHLLVINKPTGMAVHGGSGQSVGVIEAMRILRPQDTELELVHRLDKETSGCLLLARRRSALRSLHDLLRRNRVRKSYLALVEGDWADGRRKISGALRKNTLSSGERMVRVQEDGKPALTELRPVARGSVASLVEARPVTGRTHQIRVHAASIGRPIAGDAKYGQREFNQRLRAVGLRRLFLHAHSIGFEHPKDGARLSISAPLPDDLHRVLDTLGLKSPAPV